MNRQISELAELQRRIDFCATYLVNKNEAKQVAFLDFKQAFDHVLRNGGGGEM